MKGHLGFVCRVCRLPSAPQNLRQVGIGTRGQGLSAEIAWDAPASAGDGPILGYTVEIAFPNVNPDVFYQQYRIDETATTETVGSCTEAFVVRVRARNRCGLGAAALKNSWDFDTAGIQSLIFTASGSWTPPCWAGSVKVWCIGRGGTWSDGGAAGAVAWKTFTNTFPQDWTPLSLLVNDAADTVGNNPPRTSVTYGGATVTAYAAVNTSNVQSPGYSGADGGVDGNYGGTATGSFSPTIPYSGSYAYGGSIGGTISGESVPSRVTPCQRMPARDRSGLLAAVALAGGKVTEDCGITPAFGSGGVRIPYDGYGGQTYYPPGYGGGGFDSSCPGGSGCIVISYGPS